MCPLRAWNEAHDASNRFSNRSNGVFLAHKIGVTRLQSMMVQSLPGRTSAIVEVKLLKSRADIEIPPYAVVQKQGRLRGWQHTVWSSSIQPTEHQLKLLGLPLYACS
jgi:hypothetical protein